MQTGAAQVRILLDYPDLEAILGSADSCYIATGPTADDQDIVIHG